jgi:hypothetical protein
MLAAAAAIACTGCATRSVSETRPSLTPIRLPPEVCAPIEKEPVAPADARLNKAARQFIAAQYGPWGKEGWALVARAQKVGCEAEKPRGSR